MLKKQFVLALLLMLGIAVPGSAQDSIRIGAIFDLSGPTSDVGESYAAGVAAYFNFVNENGGIGGLPVELLASDYRYDTNTGIQLYDQFASQGIVAFLGWGTEDTTKLAGSAARDEIPFISAAYSETLNDPNGSTPYNFVVAPPYSDQMTILLAYMANVWQNAGNRVGDMSVAIFHDNSDFGRDPMRAANDAASLLGIGGLLEVTMPRNASDYTSEMQQADDYGVTHIIIQSTSGAAAQLVRNIGSFFGVGTVQVGCLNWCADEQFIASAGSAAEGVLGAQPFTPTSVSVSGQNDPRTFLEAQRIDLEDASLHFTQGWATAALLAEAIQQTLDSGQPLTGSNIRAALETFDGVETGGLLEPVSFTPYDHVGTRALTVYAVQNGVWTAVSNVVDLR